MPSMYLYGPDSAYAALGGIQLDDLIVACYILIIWTVIGALVVFSMLHHRP